MCYRLGKGQQGAGGGEGAGPFGDVIMQLDSVGLLQPRRMITLVGKRFAWCRNGTGMSADAALA